MYVKELFQPDMIFFHPCSFMFFLIGGIVIVIGPIVEWLSSVTTTVVTCVSLFLLADHAM